jgi:hypothetical protein
MEFSFVFWIFAIVVRILLGKELGRGAGEVTTMPPSHNTEKQ